MVLSANREVNRYVDQQLRTYKVNASSYIYKGALVGLDAADGFARPLVAGDVFIGIAYEEIDNSAGANGDKVVRVFSQGDFDHAMSGAVQADVGKAVYASADDTLTLTLTANSFVGFVADLVSAGNIIVRLDTFRTAP